MNTMIENEDLRTAIEMLGGQMAVSKRLEIPYRTIQNWYAGTRNPPPYVARMIIEIAITEDEAQNTTFDLERELEAQAETKSGEKQNEVLQEQFNAAMELADMRKKEIEGLERAIEKLEGQIIYLKKEAENAKKNTH